MKKDPLFIRVDGVVKTFYEYFGVPETISDKDLKDVYRKACFENHPDRNGNCPVKEARFKDIQSVWEWLGKKRAQYDENLARYMKPAPQQAPVYRFQWGGGFGGSTATNGTGGWW